MIINKIQIIYCKANQKYDLFIDQDYWGKFYTLSEAINSAKKRSEMITKISQDLAKQNK